MDDSLSEKKPSDAHNSGERRYKYRRTSDNAEPVTVTIESAAKKKYSYDAKQYRLDRARYRLEKKAYCAAHWTMVFLIVYTGLTLIVAVSSVVATFHTKRSADAAIAANRAWIVPDSPPQHKRVIEEANLEWHSAGKTPAISVFSWKEYFSGEFPKRMDSCADAESVVKKKPLDSLQYQAFIAEGGRYEVGLDHAPAWVGQQPIFIHGCIWYTDISSNTEKSSEFFYVAFQNKYSLPSSEGISLFFDRPFTYK